MASLILSRTSRLTTLLPRPAAYSLAASRLHTSSIVRAEVSDRDPQLGDYPHLPFESAQRRKYDDRWWDPQEKRNFGETLHEQDDVLGVWAPDVHAIPAASALRQFLVAVGVAASFASFVYITLPSKPAQPRTYPRDGLLAELGNIKETAGPAEGSFDRKEEEEGEEDDE